MKALFYSIYPAGWAVCKLLSRVWPGCLYSKLNGLSFKETTVPELPGDDWVLVKTIMGGICGTDQAIVGQKQPPDSILQAFSSMPMILGHENLAVVEKVGPAVDSSWVGKRICVEPSLCCKPRGITPPCPRCGAGQFGACENFGSDGIGKAKLPPGTSIGYNAQTGGAFGEYFVAHESQLVEVPAGISDEFAVLTDPLACSLHSALRVDLSCARRVLVYGAGVMGLGTVAALRAIGFDGQIDVLDISNSHEEFAKQLGADNFLVLPSDKLSRAERITELTGASLHKVRFGNYMLTGGYDVIYDFVSSKQSINESLKWTASRGTVVMVGTGFGGSIDLTPVWFSELSVIGAYGRSKENYAGRRIETYKLVHEMMSAGKLPVEKFLTHTFNLCDFGEAFKVSMNKAAYGAIKVAFDFRQ